jgi:4-aminobutyrate aminotransferase
MAAAISTFGISVVNHGHRYPNVTAAVKSQIDCFTHTCHHVVPYENYVRLAERLNALVPGSFAKKTIFLSTGAEAVENAIKIARRATGRSAIVSFTSGFHGRTFMGMPVCTENSNAGVVVMKSARDGA